MDQSITHAGIVNKDGLFLMCMVTFISSANSITLGTVFRFFQHTPITSSSLMPPIVFVGCVIAIPIAGRMSDQWGRKWGMAITAITAITGAVIQGAAVNEAMFCIGRLLIGVSVTMGGSAAPTYVSETAQPKYRVMLVGLYGAFFFVGSLIAALVTFGSQYIDSTWAWRLPSILQFVPQFCSLAPLPFIPESPRWLVYKDRHDEALAVLTKYHGGGDPDSIVVKYEYEEICQTLAFEKTIENTSFTAIISTKGNRWRFASGALVFMNFLFYGTYAVIWCPGAYIYPVEVLSYSTRANGMSLYNGLCYAAGLFITFVIPYAMRITWGFYLINGLWCFIEMIGMYFYFPETRGLTLEEVDLIIDGPDGRRDQERIINGLALNRTTSGEGPSTTITGKGVEGANPV